MGHRLPWHTGGCQNLHGHSYRMVVTLIGEPDERGMVLDFADIKDVVQPIVDDLDHSFICDLRDELMQEFLAKNHLKKVDVPFDTTAENLSQWLCERIWSELKPNTRILGVGVELFETTTASASYSINRGEL